MKRTFLFLVIFVAIFFSLGISYSQEIPLVDQKVREGLLTELSGEIAKEHVIEITRFDRIQASEGWHQAALYVKEQLEKYGITNAVIEKFPSNGSRKYYTWTPPMGWRVQSGELWMIKPQRERLASYEEVPTSLVKGSQTADVTAEVIAIEDGTKPEDYEGIDVKGKIILSAAYAGNVHREGVIKHGAAGVVTYLGRQNRIEYPDLVPYNALWPKLEEKDKTTFGFTISRRNAERILSLLQKGEKVIFHAKVEGEVYESNVEMMSATIRGTKYPDKEVLFMGHLDHYKPGANDNASGSAGVLEIARTIKRLIDQGLLEPPKRTIRFLWVTEWNGTVPWLWAHPEVGEKTLAALNLDMIGEDLHKCNSFFYFTKTPHSLPSFLNDLTENMTIHTAGLNITTPRGSRTRFNYRISEYSGGSDHWMFNDATIGVPALMLGHPDPFWHTIQDSPDKVDPTELKRVMFIAANVAWFIANAEDEETVTLANYVAAKAVGRIAMDVERSLRSMDAAKKSSDTLYKSYKEAVNKVRHSITRECQAVRSSAVFATEDETKVYIERLTQELQKSSKKLEAKINKYYHRLCSEAGFSPRKIILTPEEKAASKIIPKRKEIFTCPLARGYLQEKLGEDVTKQIKIGGNVAFEVANFMDGKRNLLEIRNAVSAEYGPQKLEDIKAYVTILEKAGLVEIQKRR
ncbi:MAG: M28 family peptidase [Candidatus Zixiibacteriota bacterium]